MKTLFSGVATAALAIAAFGAAFAAQAQTQPSTQSEDSVVVTITGRSMARNNSVVQKSTIEALPGAQNIIDAIKIVPGVSLRGADATNSDPWSYGINIRGFDVNLRSSKIGQTIDGLPGFNASYYLGGAPASKYLMNENVSSITISQGTADVSSASSSALGGTIEYNTRLPNETSGTQAAVTLGDNEMKRYALVYDTGMIFGNTTAYVGLSSFKACRWAYGCSDQSRIDQFHGEAKFVTHFNDNVSLTGFYAYDNATDDPIVEATRSLLDTTNAPDGSVPSFLPSRPHNGSDQNQNWAAGWGAYRKNNFGYLKLNYKVSDTLSFEVAPYMHNQEGYGYWVPPYQQIAVNNTDTANRLRTQAGGQTSTSTRYRAYYGIALGGRQRAVVPGIDYKDLDGTVVASSQCYATGTAYVSNGVASFAGLNNASCVPLQTFRTSIYGHDRYGFTSNFKLTAANHDIEGGVWVEKLDREFGRSWRQIIDVTTGSKAYYNDPQLIDFQQYFETTETKFYVQDKMTFGNLVITAGLQTYKTDIKAEKLAWDAMGARAASLFTDYEHSSDPLVSLGAVYSFDKANQIFASFSQNYGAVGDWALEKTGTDTDNLKPSVADNMEIGYRFRSTNFAASITAYDINYDNAISFRTADFEVIAPGSGGINYTAGTSGSYLNVPGIKSQGIEAGFQYRAAKVLDVVGSLTLNESTYKAAFIGGSANASADKTVAAGNEVPATPKTIANIGLNYHKDNFKASLIANYQGKTAGNASNTASLYLPARTVVDLAASFALSPKIKLQFNVNNLLDEDYIGGSLDEYSERYMRGAPRTTSVTLRAGF